MSNSLLKTTKSLIKPIFYRLPRVNFLYHAATRYIALCEGYYNWYEMHFDGEKEFLCRWLSEQDSPVIFDVGANIGKWAQLVLSVCPSAILHLFEPSPRSFEILSQRFPGATVLFNKSALADTSGERNLILYDNHQENSMVPCMGKTTIGTIVVPVTTLDEYCIEKGIGSIDLLKIDVEGAEISVLRGASHLINSANIGCIQFEYSSKWIDSRSYLRDAFEILCLDYDIYKLLPHAMWAISGYHPGLDNFRNSNYVAICKDLILPHQLHNYIRRWPVHARGI